MLRETRATCVQQTSAEWSVGRSADLSVVLPLTAGERLMKEVSPLAVSRAVRRTRGIRCSPRSRGSAELIRRVHVSTASHTAGMLLAALIILRRPVSGAAVQLGITTTATSNWRTRRLPAARFVICCVVLLYGGGVAGQGVVDWAVRAGGSSIDRGYGIASDGSGGSLVTGYFKARPPRPPLAPPASRAAAATTTTSL